MEFLLGQQELSDDTESTLARDQLVSANDNLDSTHGLALPIFALAKVAKVIWSVSEPPV